MRISGLLLGFISLLTWAGSGLPEGKPKDLGFADGKLAAIGPALQSQVDKGQVAGVSALVAREGKVVYYSHHGKACLEKDMPLKRDTIFRIYSMTKPITSTAALMLVEEGRLALNDPVSKYIPAFADLKVHNPNGGPPLPLERPMTIEHLLTHTAGLTYGLFGNSEVDKAYMKANLSSARNLQEQMAMIAALPLLDQPGTRWNYSVATDVLGHVVEVASGQPLNRFFKERIFGPLKMVDTGFFVPDYKLNRFADLYANGPKGLVSTTRARSFRSDTALFSGGGGLVGTIDDYLRFAWMLANGGELDGVRLLKAETVKTMMSNHIDEKLRPMWISGIPMMGLGFGYGGSVLMTTEHAQVPGPVGIFRWAGYANTYFWIDPSNKIIGLVFTQLVPFGGLPIEKDVQRIVYESFKP